MDYNKRSLELHKKFQGKISVTSKVPLDTQDDLATFYSPGVAEPCRKIAEDKEQVYTYTSKKNLVAVISDGSAVLGLGNIGPEAGLPVMEGKAVLFKKFAGVEAFPICLDTQDVDEIVSICKAIAPTFGGINLEDISAPRCFEIEERLKNELDIPVFHDDQHGTAIVLLAGLKNSLKLIEKDISDIRIVISGAGAAGIAIGNLLLLAGAKDIIMCDSKGAICGERGDLNPVKSELLNRTNPRQICGTIAGALVDADVFIGVSKPNVIKAEDIGRMADKPLIFAMSNPIPEIMPDDAKKGGAFIVATGRSDYPNQLNNVLVFPGIFKGALEARTQITDDMKLAAAEALAQLVENPTVDKIIPGPLEEGIADVVASAVMGVGKERPL
ncbi:MAG: NADP-dependent malic enzyme [Candidatus Gracilibacteria bacterium]|nr:NADP-dependent malic enzyme [Candidatus Gracilibacteria bacterium]